jgi:hypothetical protein
VGHQHVRHEGAQCLRRLGPVLVDVDQHVGGCQPTQLVQVHVLGTADLGHRRRLGGPGAEAGARHDEGAEAEREQQLGQAGHEAGDAHGAGMLRVNPRSENNTF